MCARVHTATLCLVYLGGLAGGGVACTHALARAHTPARVAVSCLRDPHAESRLYEHRIARQKIDVPLGTRLGAEVRAEERKFGRFGGK